MKTNKAMGIIYFIIGFFAGVFIASLAATILFSHKSQEPVMRLLNYDCGRTTQIVSYENPPPDKYIVYTTHGEYRVPENFMIYHAPGEKLLYIECIETGERQSPYPVICYENEVKDFGNQEPKINP